MTTLHSNSPRDTLARLETMVMMAGIELPAPRHPRADRLGGRPDRPPGAPVRRLAQGHQHHRGPGHGGRRHHPPGHLPLRARRPGRAARSRASFEATGVRPKFETKLARNGVKLPDNLFAARHRTIASGTSARVAPAGPSEVTESMTAAELAALVAGAGVLMMTFASSRSPASSLLRQPPADLRPPRAVMVSRSRCGRRAKSPASPSSSSRTRSCARRTTPGGCRRT